LTRDENFQIKFMDKLGESESELSDFSSYDLIVAKFLKLCTQCGVKVNEKQFSNANPEKIKFVKICASKSTITFRTGFNFFFVK
jgi:hypothetical protein